MYSNSFYQADFEFDRPQINVEGILVYINPVVRYVTSCVLGYRYGTTSAGSRQPWSADVFLCRRAAAN